MLQELAILWVIYLQQLVPFFVNATQNVILYSALVSSIQNNVTKFGTSFKFVIVIERVGNVGMCFVFVKPRVRHLGGGRRYLLLLPHELACPLQGRLGGGGRVQVRPERRRHGRGLRGPHVSFDIIKTYILHKGIRETGRVFIIIRATS